MGIERDDNAPCRPCPCIVDDLTNDLLVCQMHTVKRPHSHDAVRVALNILRLAGDDHAGRRSIVFLYATSSSMETASSRRYGPILVRVSPSRYAPHPSRWPRSSANVLI